MPDRKRPFGLIVIVVLQLVQLVGNGIQLLVYFDPSWSNPLYGAAETNPIRIGQIGLSSILILASILGVWRLKRWGWILLMLSIGGDLAVAIWQYFNSNPDYITMLISIITVFYLNQRSVQQLFLGPTNPS